MEYFNGEYFIRCLAPPSAESTERIKELLIHIANGNLDQIISMNLDRESINYGICWAACQGQVNIVEHFLSKGANPNHKFNQHTPLLIAVEKGQEQTARLLIKHKANINYGSKIDMLAGATLSNKPGMIELALESGFNINRIDLAGLTALKLAAINSKYNSFKFLLKRGAEYRQVATNRLTSLGSLSSTIDCCLMAEDPRRALEILLGHIERKEGKTAMVNYINRPSKIGMTILHYACNDQHVGAIQLLVKLGADTEVRDFWGLKPVDFVEKGGKSETTQRIKSMLEAARRASNKKS